MPYKSGKLKDQLTTTELRKLVKAHNKLYTIKIPTGATQPEIIKLINKNGYVVNHQKQTLQLRFKDLKQKITMDDAPKKKVATELEIQKKEEKKKEREEKKKKEIRKIKKQALDEDAERKKKLKPQPKPQPKPKPKPKPNVEKPKPKPQPKPKPKVEEKPKPIRRKLGETQKPKPTRVRKNPSPNKPKRKAKQPEGFGAKGSNDPKKFANKPISNKFPNRKQKVQDNPDLKDIKVIETKKPKDMKFKLPSQDPKPVKIDKSKKPPKVDKSYKIIPVKKASYPLDTSDVNDIKNIPPEMIFNKMVEQGQNIFYPWSSIRSISDIMYFHILKDNKSACMLPEKVYSKYDRYFAGKEFIKKEGETKKGIFNIYNPSRAINGLRRVITQRFLRCALNDDALVLPLFFTGSATLQGSHANMLILNPFQMTAEHFEPHGSQYKGSYVGHNTKAQKKMGGYWQPDGLNLKQAIANLNQELRMIMNDTNNPLVKQVKKKYGKKKISLKYLPPSDLCPAQSTIDDMASYQREGGDNLPSLFEGVSITEQGGYCEMWSLWSMDVRLKTLRQPASETFKEMRKLLTPIYKDGTNDFNSKSGQSYIKLIRGMSKYAWEQMMVLLKAPYNVPKNDLIKYVGGDGWKDRSTDDKMKNVEKQLDKLRENIIIKITAKYNVALNELEPDRSLIDDEKKLVDEEDDELKQYYINFKMNADPIPKKVYNTMRLLTDWFFITGRTNKQLKLKDEVEKRHSMRFKLITAFEKTHKKTLKQYEDTIVSKIPKKERKAIYDGVMNTVKLIEDIAKEDDDIEYDTDMKLIDKDALKLNEIKDFLNSPLNGFKN